MMDMKAAYRKVLPERIAALEAMRKPMQDDPSAAWPGLRLLAHRLRGSGGIYGFPEITEAAGFLEDAPEADRLQRLDHLLEVLRRVAAGG
jgi:HPt (histidine-containing phosphotransfer) domain-containing protein